MSIAKICERAHRWFRNCRFAHRWAPAEGEESHLGGENQQRIKTRCGTQGSLWGHHCYRLSTVMTGNLGVCSSLGPVLTIYLNPLPGLVLRSPTPNKTLTYTVGRICNPVHIPENYDR